MLLPRTTVTRLLVYGASPVYRHCSRTEDLSLEKADESGSHAADLVMEWAGPNRGNMRRGEGTWPAGRRGRGVNRSRNSQHGATAFGWAPGHFTERRPGTHGAYHRAWAKASSSQAPVRPPVPSRLSPAPPQRRSAHWSPLLRVLRRAGPGPGPGRPRRLLPACPWLASLLDFSLKKGKEETPGVLRISPRAACFCEDKSLFSVKQTERKRWQRQTSLVLEIVTSLCKSETRAASVQRPHGGPSRASSFWSSPPSLPSESFTAERGAVGALAFVQGAPHVPGAPIGVLQFII